MAPRSLLRRMDAPLITALVLEPTHAIIASVVVVALVIIAWKFLKFAFKIALVIAAAVALFFLLRWGGIL